MEYLNSHVYTYFLRNGQSVITPININTYVSHAVLIIYTTFTGSGNYTRAGIDLIRTGSLEGNIMNVNHVFDDDHSSTGHFSYDYNEESCIRITIGWGPTRFLIFDVTDY